MLGKLLIPAVFAAGFFFYTHQPSGSHVASAFVSPTCDAAGIKVALAWPPPPAGAQQTWVDLGVDRQFGLGWYQGHGPLPPSQQTFSITGLTLGLTYYYRVNAMIGGKFKTVAKGSFVAACAPAAPAIPPA